MHELRELHGFTQAELMGVSKSGLCRCGCRFSARVQVDAAEAVGRGPHFAGRRASQAFSIKSHTPVRTGRRLGYLCGKNFEPPTMPRQLGLSGGRLYAR